VPLAPQNDSQAWQVGLSGLSVSSHTHLHQAVSSTQAKSSASAAGLTGSSDLAPGINSSLVAPATTSSTQGGLDSGVDASLAAAAAVAATAAGASLIRHRVLKPCDIAITYTTDMRTRTATVAADDGSAEQVLQVPKQQQQQQQQQHTGSSSFTGAQAAGRGQHTAAPAGGSTLLALDVTDVCLSLAPDAVELMLVVRGAERSGLGTRVSENDYGPA
jgi:hypothetical protein